jgi:hypothetical protein
MKGLEMKKERDEEESLGERWQLVRYKSVRYKSAQPRAKAVARRQLRRQFLTRKVFLVQEVNWFKLS